MVTGTYVDPGPGRQTFAEYHAEWSARQVWAPGTETAMSLAARFTTFADVRMRSLPRSHLEHWVKSMVSRGLAPGTVHTRTNNVRAAGERFADSRGLGHLDERLNCGHTAS